MSWVLLDGGYLHRLINVGLRGLTLVSKFLLIFALAGFLEPAELGLYGLIVATVAYSMYPLGFEFYTYSTRELLKVDKSEWGVLLKSQSALHLALYALVLPLLLSVFYLELLPWYVVGWFFFLLVFEHLNQELMRLLIAISQQLTATTALFFRQGLWAVIAACWMYYDFEARNIKTVLLLWSVGNVAALSISLYKIKALKVSGWSRKVDWRWVKKGLTIAIPLFLSTLCLRGVFTIDRYWFESLQGLDILGAYVFYIGIAAALVSFLDAGVFSFIYPNMISAFNKGDANSFRNHSRSMLLQVLSFSLFFSVVSFFVLDLFVDMIGREIYVLNTGLFFWLLLVMIIQSISNIPHYALYSQGKDRSIIRSHIFSLIIFVPSVFIVSIKTNYYAVPVALCFVQFILLVWKVSAYYCQTPKSYKIFNFK